MSYNLRTLCTLLTAAIMQLGVTDLIPAEVPARYQRADALRAQTRNKVFRDRVRVNWSDDEKHVWYQVDISPDEHRYVLVDTKTGVRRDAFDHEALAKSLSEATGKEINATSLPIRTLEFSEDAKTLQFSAEGSGWKCDLTSYKLEKQEPAAGASNGTTVNVLASPRPAVRNGEETSIEFVNRTDKTIKLFWVSSITNPTFYADVEPGKRHMQHTYSGHVWMATDENRRPLGVFEAIDADGVAVVDGNWRPGRGSGRGRGGAAGRRRGGLGRRPDARGTSPDGQWTARIEDHNVVVKRQGEEEEIQLSSNGTQEDPYLARFYWSPDSKKLVVIQQREGQGRQVYFIESSPSDQIQPRLHSFDYDKPGDRIDHPRPRLFDLEQRKQIDVPEDLFSNPWSITQIRWEPDSSRFTFLYNQRGHQVLRVVAVDAGTGKASAIIDETSDTFICYSSKLFLRHLDDSSEIIWMSERDGWNHLYLYDASGKLKNQITQGEWVVRGVERVDTEKRQIWFTAGGIHSGQDPYHVHYCRVNFDGSGLVALTQGDGTHSIEFSPDRMFLIDTYSRVDLPPVTELRKSADGALICKLEEGDWSRLLETGWQPPERFVAKGRDGKTDIYGVIFRPTDFDPNKKYPVIEQIYAGPHSSHVPKRFSAYHGPQAMAELGFILVQIDGMGTSNRSKAFHDVCWQNLADAGFPDRVLWIKAAAETRPWMDITRVGIYGGSAGGQNAMRALIDHGDFYKAAAADCGCHDNRMDKIWWNEQWMGWPVGPQYAASSNVVHAGRMQGHLMLLVGEMDRNVDPASTMQVVNALIKADKDFELIVFPGGGHGSGGSPYGRRRQRDFFVRYLLGVEPSSLE